MRTAATTNVDWDTLLAEAQATLCGSVHTDQLDQLQTRLRFAIRRSPASQERLQAGMMGVVAKLGSSSSLPQIWGRLQSVVENRSSIWSMLAPNLTCLPENVWCLPLSVQEAVQPPMDEERPTKRRRLIDPTTTTPGDDWCVAWAFLLAKLSSIVDDDASVTVELLRWFPDLPWSARETGVGLAALDDYLQSPTTLSLESVMEGVLRHGAMALHRLAGLSGWPFYAIAAMIVSQLLHDDQNPAVGPACRKLMQLAAVEDVLAGLRGANVEPAVVTNGRKRAAQGPVEPENEMARPGFALLVQVELHLYGDYFTDAVMLAGRMEDARLARNDKVAAYCTIFEYLVQMGRVFYHHRVPVTESLLCTFCPHVHQLGMETFGESYRFLSQKVMHAPAATAEEKSFVDRACQQTLLRLLLHQSNPVEGLPIYAKYFEVPPLSTVDLTKWAKSFLEEPNLTPPSLYLDQVGTVNLAALLQRMVPPPLAPLPVPVAEPPVVMDQDAEDLLSEQSVEELIDLQDSEEEESRRSTSPMDVSATGDAEHPLELGDSSSDEQEVVEEEEYEDREAEEPVEYVESSGSSVAGEESDEEPRRQELRAAREYGEASGSSEEGEEIDEEPRRQEQRAAQEYGEASGSSEAGEEYVEEQRRQEQRAAREYGEASGSSLAGESTSTEDESDAEQVASRTDSNVEVVDADETADEDSIAEHYGRERAPMNGSPRLSPVQEREPSPALDPDTGYLAEDSQGHTDEDDDRPEERSHGALLVRQSASRAEDSPRASPLPPRRGVELVVVHPAVPAQEDDGYDASDSQGPPDDERTRERVIAVQRVAARLDTGYDGGDSQGHATEEEDRQEMMPEPQRDSESRVDPVILAAERQEEPLIPEPMPREQDEDDGYEAEDSQGHATDEEERPARVRRRQETGYSAGESQGHSDEEEEEVSEAHNTEDEDTDGRRDENGSIRLHQPLAAGESVEEPQPEPVVEAHTLSDMSAADELTTGHDDEVGAESSIGDDDDHMHFPPPAPGRASGHPHSSLAQYALSAQAEFSTLRNVAGREASGNALDAAMAREQPRTAIMETGDGENAGVEPLVDHVPPVDGAVSEERQALGEASSIQATDAAQAEIRSQSASIASAPEDQKIVEGDVYLSPGSQDANQLVAADEQNRDVSLQETEMAVAEDLSQGASIETSAVQKLDEERNVEVIGIPRELATEAATADSQSQDASIESVGMEKKLAEQHVEVDHVPLDFDGREDEPMIGAMESQEGVEQDDTFVDQENKAVEVNAEITATDHAVAGRREDRAGSEGEDVSSRHESALDKDASEDGTSEHEDEAEDRASPPSTPGRSGRTFQFALASPAGMSSVHSSPVSQARNPSPIKRLAIDKSDDESSSACSSKSESKDQGSNAVGRGASPPASRPSTFKRPPLAPTSARALKDAENEGEPQRPTIARQTRSQAKQSAASGDEQLHTSSVPPRAPKTRLQSRTARSGPEQAAEGDEGTEDDRHVQKERPTRKAARDAKLGSSKVAVISTRARTKIHADESVASSTASKANASGDQGEDHSVSVASSTRRKTRQSSASPAIASSMRRKTRQLSAAPAIAPADDDHSVSVASSTRRKTRQSSISPAIAPQNTQSRRKRAQEDESETDGNSSTGRVRRLARKSVASSPRSLSSTGAKGGDSSDDEKPQSKPTTRASKAKRAGDGGRDASTYDRDGEAVAKRTRGAVASPPRSTRNRTARSSASAASAASSTPAPLRRSTRRK